MDQTRLNLPLNQRTVLVPTEIVRGVLGLDAESVWAKVDTGELRWVWDIRKGDAAQIRELRFWARELIQPDAHRGLSADAVIDSVIGTARERLRAREVGQLLLCSDSLICRLVQCGLLRGPKVGHTQWIERASLAEFLRSRLLN